MKKRVIVVPIDDRPCHNDYIKEAVKNVETIELIYPPKDCLGHFTQGGNTHKLSQFILDNCQQVDAIILSIDALMYGGLVQAREINSSIDNYSIELTTILNTVKNLNPNLTIFAYSVIIRLTSTVTDSSDLKDWENIYRYSQLSYLVQEDASYQEELDTLINQIPEKKLNDYLNTRIRNHQVNVSAIQLLNDKIIDYLAIVQEDSSLYGPHIKEQETIKNLINQSMFSDKIILKNGADEMVALLLARYLNPSNLEVNLYSDLIDPADIALYEDIPLLDNLMRSFSIGNLVINPTSDLNICVFPTSSNGIDLSVSTNHKRELLPSNIFTKINDSKRNERWGILDVRNGNGGYIEDLELFINTVKPKEIFAYSAWNTASNSIGTLVLETVIAGLNKTNSSYIQLKIVDDALYQGYLRRELNILCKDYNIDVWANNNGKVDSLLTELINNEVNNYKWIHLPEIKASLPWGRTFEVLLEVNDERI